MVTLLVCGGRDFNDREFMFRKLDAFHEQYEIAVLVHGAYRGADLLAEAWAKDRAVPYIGTPAYWKRFGPRAGPERNGRMLALWKPDVVLAFPGGDGTNDMISQAKERGLKVFRAVLDD